MIKAVIFDFGGVFTKNASMKSLSEMFGKDSFETIRKKWLEARVDEKEDFFTGVAGELQISPEYLKNKMLDYFGFNKEVERFSRSLAYKIGLLSNTVKGLLDEQLERYGLHDLFDAIVTSYKTGAAKPDEKMFGEILRKLDLKAEECIFIDDMQKNTHVADKLGFKVIRFENFSQMKKEFDRIIQTSTTT